MTLPRRPDLRHDSSMAEELHQFGVEVRWTGNLGAGTENYRAYSRNHEICAPGKAAAIRGSSDPAFRGDAARYNPEELLVAALSTCHMLWMLHLCAEAGIVVTEYSDSPAGSMVEDDDGSGRFTEVVLRPRMAITEDARAQDALALHDEAHRLCFIANSVRFPVRHEAEVVGRPR
jgi:organic hydroperoxide reductase OsmC/OhrA